MTENKYDLSVVYRIYPKISKTIAVDLNDKYELAHLCLKSFKSSLGSLKAKIWVLLDKCPPKYEALFKKYFDDEDLIFIKLNGIGNYNTFKLQLKILLKQNYSNIVYFAEDDYFYLPNQFQEMISFLKKDPDVHILIPFDYPTFYNDSFHNYKSYIKVHGQKHWRSVNSAGCNFLTTKNNLRDNFEIFMIYSTGNTVFLSSCVCLTKYKVFNPFAIVKFAMKNRMFFIYYYKAWRYGWKKILFGKKQYIWSPIPSIATTMDRGVLAPTIKWRSLFVKAIKDLKDN